ncbi:MAG: bifunctional adenosylcobinamide kinase/adenosylcobinamide-phosphate guanylyltransferase [Clostridiales bacterium]|nr:bifunctional adenosylcobinamide kinase/adenosylcobinamide-phosphate guanylyltransferase [Clostridiales bacterium]
MIVIVGGRYQGKREFARKLSGLEETEFAAMVAQAGRISPEEAIGKRCLVDFQDFLRRIMESGTDPQEFVSAVLETEPEIVTLAEVGSGLVPMERFERDWRDAVGVAGQRLAARADTVYRVTCGLPLLIKGENK